MITASFRFLSVSVVVVHLLPMNIVVFSYVTALPQSIPHVLFCEILGTSSCAAPLMRRKAGETVCPVVVLFDNASRDKALSVFWGSRDCTV